MELYSWMREEVTGYSTRCFSGATWPLMYQLRLAEGKELKEEQLATRVSPGLYIGSVPVITGPSSGRSEMTCQYLTLLLIISHENVLLR